MNGFINNTAPQFTSVEISKNSTSQKRENFILYFSSQTQNELRKKDLKLLADILNYFINIGKKVVNLIQKKEIIRLTFEFRFNVFFRFFFFVNIFKNTNTYPINDLYYETSLCRITRRFSRVGGLLIFVKLWGMFKSNFFLNFLEFFLCLVGASLQMVAFFYPVDPRGLIMYKRGVLVRSSKYWERNAIFFSLIGGLQYYEWKMEA